MIKVLLNGTPIYKLCFSRRVYKTVGRKRLTPGQLINAIKDTNHYAEGDWEAVNKNVADSIRKAFGGKPLYETTALVFMIDAKQGEPPVATASTKQSRKDDNRRSTGREVALGRLLQDKDSPPFNPFERKAIREAYENRYPAKTPSKPTPPSGAGSVPIAQVRRASAHTVVSKTVSERRLSLVA